MNKIKDFIVEHKRICIISGSAFILLAIIVTGVFIVLGGSDEVSSSDVKETKNQETTTAANETTTVENTEQTSVSETQTEEEANDPQTNNQMMDQADDGVTVDADNLDLVSNEYEVSGITYGIDVSKWQGTIDWNKVKAAGIEYAMIRVGYRTEGNGTICEDSYAQYNLQQAESAGIKVGVYFFSTAISTEEAQEEAAWVVDFISKYKITYPVVYNCEGFTESDSRMYSLSNADRTNIAMSFLSYIQDNGYTPMLYASTGELTNSAKWDTDKISSKYKVWVAQYTESEFTSDSKSSYNGTHAMWQYTNKGIIDGVTGSVDMNIAYFGYSEEAQAKDTSGTEAVTAPTQKDPFDVVNDQVTAKIETNLRTEPNGTTSTVAYVLKNGEFVNRIGINNTTGWSKISYNGQTLYAVTSYLTTSSETYTETVSDTFVESVTGMKFIKKDQQVTAKELTNLRTVPTTDGNEPVAQIKKGEFVTQTGISENGAWAQVDYNGQTLYAVSSLLASE